MKFFLPLALILLLSHSASAEIWNVEVGGGGFNGNPYFLPQNLTINQGDEVIWTWVSGAHNVTQTSGPVFFASGNKVAPATWAFIFEVPGTYNYECSIEGHALTQFGQIVVSPTSSVLRVSSIQPEVLLFPNPASGNVSADITGAGTYALSLIDLMGRVVMEPSRVLSGRHQVDLSTISPGIYFIELRGEGVLVRKRLTVR